MDDYSLDTTPLHEIVNHPKVQAFLSRMKDDMFNVDMSLMDEIKSYVSIAKETREKADKIKLPDRYKTKDDLHALCAFIARVQAYRDRVVEIKLDLMPIQRSIHRIYKKASDQLYHFTGIAKASPAPVREAAIGHILAPIEDHKSKIDMLVDSCNEVDRNLGNAWFSLKELRAIGAIYIEAKDVQEGI